jgi:Glycosyl transferase family 2
VSTISVIIATYGGQEWADLAGTRAMRSVRDYDELRIHHDPGGTRASSLNHTAAQSGADWLCFLDADDELAPGYLGAMRRALEHATPLALLTPAVQQIRKGRPRPPFFYPECSFETGNWLVIGTLISRSLFTQIGGFHEHPHGLEDWNLWARAVRAGATITKVPDAVYVAHWNHQSKHHKLFRDRRVFRAAYEAARLDAWG